MNKPVIAICGVARSGKDTLCALLIEELGKLGLKAKRFALADRLKAEIREFAMTHYGIDILNCPIEEKEMLREFLVFHGKMKRIKSQGKHWTGMLEPEIRYGEGFDVAIITDVRYDIFPEDELSWVKDHMSGAVVHVTRYAIKSVPRSENQLVHGRWVNVQVPGTRVTSFEYVKAPNADEALNDPRLESKSDFKIQWNTGDIEQYCRPEALRLVNFLREKAYISL